jgi:hypothetical protein
MNSIESPATSSVADINPDVVQLQIRVPALVATRLRVAAAKANQRPGQYLAQLVEQHVPEVK